MKYCLSCNEQFDDSLSFCPRDGEVLEEDPTSLLGTVLDGQYQIEALLGKGGMGAVYRARHILLGDRVAIKLLPPEMRSNTEWLRRFQREGQAARRFRHPNAVTVYDLRTSGDGTIYLVMEYVEGSTLDTELKRRGRFSPAEALAVLDPIMSVLNAAHAMGVVHRDLKPENIMVGKSSTGGQPVVKLLDLGIAKLREVAGAEKIGTTALTMAGQMLGTPYYMSPEQWGELPEDRNSEIDGRADIYSLGVVFYELIAGKRPFTGVTLSEVRRQHLSVTPPPLHEVAAGVPDGFSRAIARAIAKDRSERQATADELESELRTALAAEGIAPSASATSTPPLHPAAGTSETDGAARGSITAAERTAPTIVTGSFSEAEGGVPVSAPDFPSQAATMPTVVVGEQELAARAAAAAGSRAAVPMQGSSTPVTSSAPTGRRSPLLFVGVTVIALLLAGGGIYAFVHFTNSNAGKPSQTDSSNATSGTDLAAGGHEVGRYWLEVETKDKSDAIRAGDLVITQPGQGIRFHFSPNENGYLYIIGPGTTNTWMTFLTAQPSAKAGLKTNEVKSGLDFIFPADTSRAANWIRFVETAGREEFIIVFSPNPIANPPFFAGPSEHELTPDEQKQLDDFRGARANAVTTEVIKTGAFPAVSVKVPQTREEGMPVIFRVRIEHK